MKFFAFNPDSDSPLYSGMSDDAKRDLPLWEDVSYTVTFNTGNISAGGQERVLLLNVIDPGTNLEVRRFGSGNTRILNPGVHEFVIRGNDEFLIVGTATIAGLVYTQEIGQFEAYHYAKGRTQSRPTIKTAVTRKQHVLPYAPSAQIDVRFMGASRNDVNLITRLRQAGRFWCYPSLGNTTADAEWAYQDKLFAMSVGAWNGFTGNKGTVIGGAHGQVSFVETSKREGIAAAVPVTPPPPQAPLVEVLVQNQPLGGTEVRVSQRGNLTFDFDNFPISVGQQPIITVTPRRTITEIRLEGVAATDLFARDTQGRYQLRNPAQYTGSSDIQITVGTS